MWSLTVAGDATGHPKSLIVDRQVLEGWNRVVYALSVAVWVATTLLFWSRWVQPLRVGNWWLFIAISIGMAYEFILMPGVCLILVWHMTRPDPSPAPARLRAAMVTPIVPSAESLEVLEQTPTGMVATRYPHDSWVLDALGDPAVRALWSGIGTRQGRYRSAAGGFGRSASKSLLRVSAADSRLSPSIVRPERIHPALRPPVTTTIPVMSDWQKLAYACLASLWLASVAVFFAWWFRADHVVTIGRMIVTSCVVGYTVFLPGYFVFFLGRMRRPNPMLPIPRNLKVTFATTFVPGVEGTDILERTITAMRDQVGYPHDVWVLDEGDAPEVRALCARVGAKHFSRKGIAKYQSAAWPFKAKTKAGNYNAWLDWMAARGISYDILLQMDTDHVPQPGYMVNMLRAFADPNVAYVAAPSIVSGNRGESWVVGARYEIEATTHGALQMGYNSGFAPIIIGSHAAFRVGALQAIGGFQHTLAEDHHNTLRLNASGRRGVFAPDAIAIGDGANCFANAMIQEYQWARALTQILLTFFPKDSRMLSPRLWFQFFFAETWYVFFAMTQLVGWLMPAIAIVTGVPWVRVSYLQFAALYSTTTLATLLLVSWVKWQGWLRPQEARALTWRSTLLMLTRWPYVLMGVMEAAIGRMAHRDFPFRVTPKGAAAGKSLPIRLLLPYVLLVAVSLAATAYHLQFQRQDSGVDGYMGLALLSAVLYIGVLVVVVARDLQERVRDAAGLRRRFERNHVVAIVTAVALTVALYPMVPAAAPRVAMAVMWRGGPSAPAPVRSNLILAAEPLGAASGGQAAAQGPSADEVTGVDTAPTRRLIQVSQPFLGIYDPTHQVQNPNIQAEMVYVQWKPTVDVEIAEQTNRILAAGRLPIVTIEPWPFHIQGLEQPTLLTDIAVGRYDPTIDSIANVIASYAPQVIYIRFGHEMDLAGTYPWAQGKPELYIPAYRHVVEEMLSRGASNARWIWSPSGNAGSSAYYPGADVVDVIGVTVLVNQAWESQAGYTIPRSFRQIFDERYPLAYQFNKPIMVAEFGVSLPSEQAKEQWLAQAHSDLAQYARLLGAVYFDAMNPPISGLAERPDWRLSPEDQAALYSGPIESPRGSGSPGLVR